MEKGNVPGVFVAVVQGNEVVYQKSFGVADVETKKKLSSETCMELGSLSKTFTAELILHLHQNGQLHLDSPVNKYLPDAPGAWAPISIRHFLDHTSGLRNYLMDQRFGGPPYPDITKDSVKSIIYSQPVEFSPGSSWSYSNSGYYLLGLIAESVTGRSYFELVKQLVIQPMDLKQTWSNDLAAQKNCLAQGYYPDADSLLKSEKLGSDQAFAAGAWASSGEDMIRFVKAIHARQLPSDRSRYDWRSHRFPQMLPFSYHAGRFYSEIGGKHVYSHNGGTPGFTSSWFYVLEDSISVIVLVNRRDYALTDQLAWEILEKFNHSLRSSTRAAKSDSDEKSELVRATLMAILNNEDPPAGVSEPLRIFLSSENGKGFWQWVFEEELPKEIECREMKSSGNQVICRYKLSAIRSDYNITAIFNDKNELAQILWW